MEPEINTDQVSGSGATDFADMDPQSFVQAVTESENLVDALSEDTLSTISRQVIEDFNLDYESMSDWRGKMEKAIKLANLVKDDKNYPFDKAANIKYPLITSAALQFNARAYPAIVSSESLVKTKVHGNDRSGQKAARGERVAHHMSYQLLNRVDEWEEATDSLLVQLPIVGTMVRKWWYDPVQKRPKCRLLKPGAFVVNDSVTNLSDAPRCSEELPLYPTEIQTRINSGQFVDFEYERGEDKQEQQDFIEQHCRIDMDDDGYDEPYIVTVHKENQKVVRIVADFSPDDVNFEYETQMQVVEVPMQTVGMDGQPVMVMTQQQQPVEVATSILGINRGSYFVAYRFMPSIDGGFHGTGLGLLLGDISETINSIMNMLMNAGHMASLGGGWIGSDFRIKGGAQRFKPGEWKLAQSQGNTIRESVVPMTFPGPDAVLFQMLGMLIDAGKEISSTKDIMTGDTGGRVQTATATIALIEQGMMVFTAAYKRIFRSLKQEYKLLGGINAQTVDPQEYSQFHDETDEQGQPAMLDPQADYGAADMDIMPVADPQSVTKMQEMAKAQLLREMAEAGLIDPVAAGQRVLEAAQIGDVDELAPKPDPMAEPMQKFQLEMAQIDMALKKAEVSTKMVGIDKSLAEIEKMKADTIKTMADAEAQDARLRLDAMSMILKEQKSELERSLKIGLAGLAAESRDRSDARRAQVAVSKAAQSSGGSVLGGQPMPGGSPQGVGIA